MESLKETQKRNSDKGGASLKRFKTSQFEIVLKSSARFNTQFRVKESLKLLLVIKIKNTLR